MSHSFSKIWIHAVWATKERAPFITTDNYGKVFEDMEADR